MDRSTRLRTAVALSVVLLVSCSEAAGPSGPTGGEGEVVMAFGADPGPWSADPLRIDSARVEAHVLHVHASHSGGCAEHEYAAVAWNGWLESHPVQVGLIIAHDDQGDPCDGLLFPELRFGLEPLREAYREAHGPAPATLVLRLSPASDPAGDPVFVEYEF